MSDSLLLKLYTCQLQMRSHAFQGPRQMGVGLGDVDSNFNFHETTAKNLEHWYFQLIQISCFNKRSNLHRISGHLKQIESDFSPKRTRPPPPPPLAVFGQFTKVQSPNRPSDFTANDFDIRLRKPDTCRLLHRNLHVVIKLIQFAFFGELVVKEA